MDRRNTLKWLWVSALGLIFPVAPSQSTDKVSIDAKVAEDTGDTLFVTPSVACRVIGVGDAGCNIVLAAWSSRLLPVAHCRTEFSCVSMARRSIRAVIKANRLHPGIAPIRPVQLGRYGAGGNVNVARAAAKKHDGTLRSLVDGAEIVILTAGLGGGTGSAVGATLARMAMEAGALVLGVIVTPFKWELGRYPNAFAAVKALEENSHYLVSLPNEKIGELLGERATLDDLFVHQALLGVACIRRLMFDGSRYCIESRHRSTQ